MKKIVKAFATFAAVAMLGTGFMACSDGSDGGSSEPVPDSGSSSTNLFKNSAVYPANGATDAYADTVLMVKFDSAPVIADNAQVVIKSGETTVDTIKAKNETLNSLTMSGGVAALNVRDQLMVLEDNVLVILPHNDSAAKYLIQPETTYTVTVSGVTGTVKGASFNGSAAWSFTTKAAPSIEGKEITVGHNGTEDFFTLQGALSYIKASDSSENWTIKLSSGKYHERNFYNGNASVKIEGPAGKTYGEGTEIYFMNNNQWNGNTRDRVNFLWQGKDLTLKNVTLKSTFTRAAYGSQNADATDGRNEVIYFDSKSNMAVYNCSFIGTQDTLILGGNGGKAWFYDSYVQGDVDFIWGTLDVCLLEKCKIVCQGGDTTASYIFASRTPTTSGVTGKGFIVYNSDILIDGIKAYYGRDMGNESQAAVINSKITTANGGTLNPTLWLKASTKFVRDINEEVAVGFVDFGNTLNGTAVDVSGRLAKTETMSERLVNREYNGRSTILNRGYNELTQKYVDTTAWDISALETEFGATADASTNNFYVEPVYVKDIVGGSTEQLTIPEGATVDSSDTELATVNAAGLVTTASGKAGSVTISVTKNGHTDTCTLKVIAEQVPATATTVTLDKSSVEVYGYATATVAFEPANTTDKTVTLTSSNDKVLFWDEVNSKLVASIETTAASVKLFMSGTVDSATITATSKATPAATAGTATIATTAGEKIWSAETAPWRMATDIQNGSAGLWDELVIDSAADGDVITTAGKMSLKGGGRMQIRNVSIFVPVDGASILEFGSYSAVANVQSIGTAKTEAFTKVSNYVYQYTYDGGTTGVVNGDDSSIPTTFAKKAGNDVSATQKYLRFNVIGAGGQYFTYIKIKKTGDFNNE